MILGFVPKLIDPAAAAELQADRAQTAQTAQTSQAQPYRIDIRMMTLSAALKELAKQTSLQFARFSDVSPMDIVVGPLSGIYTRAQALELLLRGTGLTYRFVNDRTVAIVAPAARSAHPAVPPPLAEPAASPRQLPMPTRDAKKNEEKKSVTIAKNKGGLLGRIASLFALCGPVLAAGPAYCQNAPADTTSTADTGTNQLQEVVVTAERRTENVQTTPIAVTALTGDQLRADNVTNIENLQEIAPALSIVDQGTYKLVMIRGVGNASAAEPTTTGVPMILDNMVNPRGTGLNWAWFDIGDVETLRGPQGTLVGANSTAGAILVTSANPNFRGVNGYATAQAGNYHDDLLEAAVNLPISDTLAMRVAVHSENENSFYYDDGYSKQQLPDASQSLLDPGNMNERSGRVSLLWKPTSNFQLLLKAQLDQNNTDGIPYNVSPNTYSPLPGLACPSVTEPNGTCATTYLPNYSGHPFVLNYSTYTKADYWDRFYSGDARYTLPGDIVLHFYAGSEESQDPEIDANCNCSANDGWSTESVASAEPAINNYFQMELISPNTGKFNWIVGSAYVRSESPSTAYEYLTGPAPDTVAAPGIDYFPLNGVARQLGIYGNINWQFTDTLQLEAGLRGNWDNNVGTGDLFIWPSGTYTCATTPCIFPNSPALVSLDNQGKYVANHQTGKVGINWTPLPGEFFYAFFARGYEPGVSQFHAFTAPEVNGPAETLNDYELGWKGTFLGGRLTNQLGIYYDDYYNMQQTVFNPANPNNGGIAGVPHALIDGIEESLQTQLGHFGANIAAAYTHSALSPLIDVPTYEFPPGVGQSIGAYLPACPPKVASGATCFNYSPYIINLKGEEDPYAPELTASVTVQYGIPIGHATLQPRVQFSYTSKQFASILQNNSYYEMNQRDLWNAYLDFIDGRWDTTLYGTNLTNETYMTNQTGTQVLYGAPLQYGVKTTFTF